MRRTFKKSVVTLCALAGVSSMQGCVVDDILTKPPASEEDE